MAEAFHSQGPPGRIGFAISARMSEALHTALKARPESAREPCGEAHPAEIRKCTDVPFGSSEKAGTVEFVHDAARVA